MRQVAVPVFKLYGEVLQWPTPDLLHCETIPKRSRLHHWEIRPHRHADLAQWLYLHKGQAEIEIEGQLRTVRQATLQYVPPLCVHGFRFSENVEGYVITLAAPLVAHLQAAAGLAAALFERPAAYPAGRERGYLQALFSTLHREYQGQQPGRELMLQSCIQIALVWCSRQALNRQAAAAPPARGRELMARFNRLLEAEYTRQPSVEALAHRLGVSAGTLNATCRQWAGHSALPLLHQRLLLEAQRRLTYTTSSVSQISDALGFADPAYFARFFRRLAGASPRAFRLAGDQALARASTHSTK
ncbi:helix-turn-helix domain-containing protein [Pseudomonas sp. NPDC007930]|uniref:helix-turn-helix domain-containing protein n=1 Tax=Pseudomonas sp. NPDC007930 TaxID=3364417 RepID=UPI0036EB37B0